MPTLKEITYEIVDNFGKTNDYSFVKRIENLVISMKATVIRQEYDKTGRIHTSNVYSLELDTELVPDNMVLGNTGDIDCFIIKTIDKVPKPLRLKRTSSFDFVGDTNSEVSYTEISVEMWKHFRKGSRFIGNTVFFMYVNEYLYIFNRKKGKIALRYVPADERDLFELKNAIGSPCEEEEIIIDEDMSRLIRKLIYEEMATPIPKNDEINLNEAKGD